MAELRVADCTAERAPPRLLRRINKIMREAIDERLAPLGVSYPQWATVKLVADGTISTAGELARDLDYTTGATTRLIDGLEAMALIARSRDREDRRIVTLAVTPKGETLARDGRVLAMAIWNELLATVDQKEADQFVETLVKLEAAAEAIAARRPVQEAAE